MVRGNHGQVESLSLDFSETTTADWRASVDAVLARGREDLDRAALDRLFARVLTTTTDDGIVLQPLYTADDAPAARGLPGAPPFVRAATAAGCVPTGWEVRQRVDARDPHVDGSALRELENGATALWLGLDERADVDTLDAALAGVYLELVPVVLDAEDPATAAAALRALWERRGLDPSEVRAVLGFDPLGRQARTGRPSSLADAVAEARQAAAELPGVRTLVVDGTPYHDAGATEADELAFTLSTGVAYLRALTDGGLDVPEALGQLEFRYAATDNQFLTLARLRAARALWARVAEACGAPQAGAQRQHAVTSQAMLTRYDAWVNLLRTTVACFAAGLGGADAVTVVPHDVLLPGSAGDLGRRLARNTQTILLEESHLGRVVDPAGGSWFVETLTDELARTAWERFQLLEQAGGMAAAWESGLVRAWVDEAHERRRDRVAHRRRPITGVSEFPLLGENVPAPPAPPPGEGLPVRRWAEPFEALRDRAARHREVTGDSPRVFLATLGPLAEHNARASFCANLFAAGGIESVLPGTVTADDVAAAFATSGAGLACIVGGDPRYAQEAAAVAAALTRAGPARLYLAGDPGDLREALDAAGVAEYVVAGGDAVAVLSTALDAAGVAR